MTKAQPLYVRLYFLPQYYELARLIGYAGLSIEAAQAQAKPLGETYGKKEVQAAADEILHFDHQAGTVRIKDEVRKFCFQLLGPPPEQAEQFHGVTPSPLAPAPNGKAVPAPKRKRRPKGASA